MHKHSQAGVVEMASGQCQPHPRSHRDFWHWLTSTPTSRVKDAHAQDASLPTSATPHRVPHISGVDDALLIRETWLGRALGAVYGGVLDDAFGLSTEFLSKETALSTYGLHFDPMTREGHIPFPDEP